MEPFYALPAKIDQLGKIEVVLMMFFPSTLGFLVSIWRWTLMGLPGQT